ncbi:hypothetical protein BDQ17DRAFT_1250535, partial [Cyathus striatus]
VCTCLSFVTSRFLVCKHLIQGVHRVPAAFFNHAKCHRTTPFWKHEIGDEEVFIDVEQPSYLENMQPVFEEDLNSRIDLLTDFIELLKYQWQFKDQQMLQVLEKKGASLFALAEACQDKEKNMNATAGRRLSTWDKATSDAMFFHTRPALNNWN